MMSSNGPPTPKGVGGPTPSLVSKGSEEEGGTRIPTGGFPSSDGRGDPTSPPLWAGGRRWLPQRDEGGSPGIRRLTRSPPLPNEEGKTLFCPKEGRKRRNVVYWNPNGRSSMISCAIKSFKRHSQGMSLFMVCVLVF